MTNIRITTGDTQTVPSGKLDSGDPAQLGGRLQLGGTLAITDEQPLRASGTATGDGRQIRTTTVGEITTITVSAGETLSVDAGETVETKILSVDGDGTVDVDENGTLNVGQTDTLTVGAGETFETTELTITEFGEIDVDDNGTLNVGVTFDGATLSTIVPIIRQSNRTLEADSDQ